MRQRSLVRSTSLGAFAAHALDREQNFLPVGTYAKDDEQRDHSRFAVEPHAHNRAVENEPHDRFIRQRADVPGVPVGFHLAPGSAHRVLAHRTAKQRRERATDAARVGTGQVGTRDHRVRRQRAALVGTQCLALPFPRLAFRGVEPGARHCDLDTAERAQKRARPVAMAMAAAALCLAGLFAQWRRTTCVAGTRQRRLEFVFHHGFDERAHAIAQIQSDQTSCRKGRVPSRLQAAQCQASW